MLAVVCAHSGGSVVGTGLVIALSHLMVQQLETLNVIFDWLTLAHTQKGREVGKGVVECVSSWSRLTVLGRCTGPLHMTSDPSRHPEVK